MHTPTHRILLAASALLLAPSASAQSQPTWAPYHEIEWGGTELGSGKLVTRLVAGEITPDLRTDVVAQGGTLNRSLLLLGGPASNEGLTRLAPNSNVRDFDLSPPDASGRQGVVFLDQYGLHVITVAYVDNETVFTTADLCLDAGWPAAKMVRTGLLNSGSATDYLGLGVDLKTILVLLDGTTSSSFLIGPRVHEILPGNYTGDGRQEIALLLQTGIGIYDETGTELWFVAETLTPGSRLARLPGAAAGLDALAWLTRPEEETTTTLRLAALPGGVISGATRAFTQSEFTALTAGDANGDGLQDLLIAQVDASEPILILNTGSASAPAFAVGNGPLSPLGSPEFDAPLANVAAPVFADLNQDGRPDLLVPACTSGSSIFHLYTATPLPGGFVEWPEVPYGQEGWGAFLGITGLCDEPGVVITSSAVGEFGYYDPEPPEDEVDLYNFLEVRIWRRHPDHLAHTHPVCVSRTAHHIGDGPDAKNMFRATGIDFSPLLGGTNFDPELSIVWLEARWIKSDTLPAIDDPLVGSFDPSPMAMAVVYLCGDSVCSVLPAQYVPTLHFGIEVQVTPWASFPECAYDTPSCPTGSLGTACGIHQGNPMTNVVLLHRPRPGPPPPATPSMPAQPVRKADLQPFLGQ